jgi:hypothetical protein
MHKARTKRQHAPQLYNCEVHAARRNILHAYLWGGIFPPSVYRMPGLNMQEAQGVCRSPWLSARVWRG